MIKRQHSAYREKLRFLPWAQAAQSNPWRQLLGMVSCLSFWKNSMYKSAYVNTDFFEQTHMGDSYTLFFQVAFFHTEMDSGDGFI